MAPLLAICTLTIANHCFMDISRILLSICFHGAFINLRARAEYYALLYLLNVIIIVFMEMFTEGPEKSVFSQALHALGEVLAAQQKSVAVVAVGDAALILQGLVQRVTQDIDIIALARDPGESAPKKIESPEPLPVYFSEAILRVARDFNLPLDWMNAVVGLQWKTGLPPGFAERIHWRRYEGLWLGVADRYDLIFLKLFAAADSEGPSSVHFQDLMALDPTENELDEATEWVRSQDTAPEFAHILEQVVGYAKRN